VLVTWERHFKGEHPTYAARVVDVRTTFGRGEAVIQDMVQVQYELPSFNNRCHWCKPSELQPLAEDAIVAPPPAEAEEDEVQFTTIVATPGAAMLLFNGAPRRPSDNSGVRTSSAVQLRRAAGVPLNDARVPRRWLLGGGDAFARRARRQAACGARRAAAQRRALLAAWKLGAAP
jgi:hypothetical protein